MKDTENTALRAEQKKKGGEAPTFLQDSELSRSICSSHDCTGLIPSLPSGEAELEAYEELYQFCLPITDPPPAGP